MSLNGISTRKCILVTGATSGIGRALALALADLPSKPQVVAAGRRKARLEELEQRGLNAVSLDLSVDKEALKANLRNIVATYPDLDAVVLNAGIQRNFDLTSPRLLILKGQHQEFLDELHVNYTANVFAVNYLLPHFKKLNAEGRHISIIIVTSGLCMVPSASLPNYSATKAALHSYAMALRASFVGTNIHVVEIIPPLVESELHDAAGTTEKLSKTWMSLDEFIKLVMPPLVNGDDAVPIGMAATVFQKFEAGKSEMAITLALNHASGKGYAATVKE
ncbi:NAD(P)-binding protein [Hymenopellis radicata]|nr:NAD(P)-binding protein [Hymenopellis radicata]